MSFFCTLGTAWQDSGGTSVSLGFGHECRSAFLHPVEQGRALSLGLASGSCVWTAARARAVAPPRLQAQRPACAARRPFHPPGPLGSGAPRASSCVLSAHPAAPLTCLPVSSFLLSIHLPFALGEFISSQACVSAFLVGVGAAVCPLRPSWGVASPACPPRVCRSGGLSAPPCTLFPFLWSPQAFPTGRWPDCGLCPRPGVLEGPWRLCVGGDPQYQSLSLQCL